jgi:hypothetical protein
MGKHRVSTHTVALLRAFASILGALALSACGIRSPITNRLTLDFDKDGKRLTVTVVTEIDTEVQGQAISDRIDAAREALLAGRDDWSNRFAAVDAESERLAFVKKRGVLQRAEHSAVIDRDALQRFFGDLPMTIGLTHGEGGTELAIYANSSTRATREQREHVEKAMQAWCSEAAHYLAAMNALYGYLVERPDRAEAVFTVLFSEHERSVNKREQALIESVTNDMDAIFASLRPAEKDALTLDDETDLVYNPFPAEIVVHLPHEIVAVENFEKRSEDTVAIRRAGLVDAIASLQGRWVSPDPLALAIRADQSDSDIPSAAWFASQPRKSSAVVTALDIQNALVEKLRPATTYKVRWAE